jgi:hypothetical protein
MPTPIGSLLDALDVAGFGGVDFYFIASIDEGRNIDD